MTTKPKRYKFVGLKPVWVPAINQWVNPGDTVELPPHLDKGDSVWREVKSRSKRKVDD